ncbi:helix-turn-helix domain-containing protein [Pseudomarimonas arenosa]|uniref:Helix-turn-helix transcriptional regulator n=1 Tax=Pseudomarimonas arenosa TaxID=2774145 RepID=A0AAW3ZPX2_9GAMM|nr:helix-turn-helix transcriptional regulator [Pseudomarimonas arenosa]MBD8526657.1 helix-turn-helix transcriptional regulator [Pseudomarimonas arenosa]
MTLRIELIDALKRMLKQQGLTYAELADRLTLSEATVKRVFSQRSLNLDRLEQICDVLGVGLAELSAEANRHREPLAELSVEQETELVSDPALLLALYLVLNRFSEAEVKQRYKFTVAEWTLLLTRLDRLGVIELQPGNKCRLRTARNFRWRRNGPMQALFQKRLLPEYFAAPFEDEPSQLILLSGMLSERAAHHLQRRMQELAEEFDLLLAQDAALPADQRQGLSLVFACRPWSLNLFDRYRKTRAQEASNA